jgi:hypothetical protein
MSPDVVDQFGKGGTVRGILAVHASLTPSLTIGHKLPLFGGNSLRRWQSAGDQAIKRYNSDPIVRKPVFI